MFADKAKIFATVFASLSVLAVFFYLVKFSSLFSTLSPPPSHTATPTPDIFEGLPSDEFYITFYGWSDNSPPGNAIAYPKSRTTDSLHGVAGGTGTYENPVTFASDPKHISPGEIYYVVYLKKYIVMEDYCLGCVDSWNSSTKHIDIWMESDTRYPEELFDCQKKLTRDRAKVIIDPPSNLSVNSRSLFDKATGQCGT